MLAKLKRLRLGETLSDEGEVAGAAKLGDKGSMLNELRHVAPEVFNYRCHIVFRPCGRIDSGIGFGVPGTNPV
ncbi:hypothetical protein [Shinella granuli]|uniref:hypothetical protein n=1 Tax=Shinella granuli TaxID=323621 RepID=UPI0013C2FDEB|nr:hypothetical protein [Shinella granuli]